MNPFEKLAKEHPWPTTGGSPVNPVEPDAKLKAMAMRFVKSRMAVLGVGESAGLMVAYMARCFNAQECVWITALDGPPLISSLLSKIVLVKEPAIRGMHHVHTAGFQPQLVWLECAGDIHGQCSLIEVADKLFPSSALAGDGYEFDWVQAACRATEERFNRRLEENGEAWGFAARSWQHPMCGES